MTQTNFFSRSHTRTPFGIGLTISVIVEMKTRRYEDPRLGTPRPWPSTGWRGHRIYCTGRRRDRTSTNKMAAAPKRIGILLEFNYEDLEVWYPLLRFREEGMETFTVAPAAGKTYTSKKGYPCVSDREISSVTPQDLDVLIIPGGWAPDYWRRDHRFVELVRSAYELGKPVAAICHGAWMLCSAQVLSGKRATCFHSIKDDVINAGGKYEDSAVVVDGNLITSRVPSDLPQFCKAILEQLQT